MSPTDPPAPPPRPAPENDPLPVPPASEPGFWADYLDFLRCTRRWWLIPILLALALLAALIYFAVSSSNTPAYPVF